jgi:hypothetical protein
MRIRVMTLRAGARIWIPCEVKPGPFSDERLVRVRENGHEWVGFVPPYHLKEPIKEGSTFISALVIDVKGEKFSAQLPGEALTPSLFKGEIARAQPVGPLEA